MSQVTSLRYLPTSLLGLYPVLRYRIVLGCVRYCDTVSCYAPVPTPYLVLNLYGSFAPGISGRGPGAADGRRGTEDLGTEFPWPCGSLFRALSLRFSLSVGVCTVRYREGAHARVQVVQILHECA
eukprot:3392831-Rhodomonas_salina.1